MSSIPKDSYGAYSSPKKHKKISDSAKHVKEFGYAVVDSGLSNSEVSLIADAFDELQALYIEKFNKEELEAIEEKNIFRMPLAFDEIFLKLPFNQKLVNLIEELIEGEFILNQQNALINPPQANYSQAKWHRDLPYQHFVTSKPIAISALFCIDDFTHLNGATHVLPGSHKEEWLPSENQIHDSSKQLEASSGQFIIIDSMAFHSGGINNSDNNRRGINHVFTIPYFKQQINFHDQLQHYHLSDFQQKVLGFRSLSPSSLQDFFKIKMEKQ
ncbi:phytanoyl-CoA dioxygenase family protein [Gammaproteobacteria bacterium]|jgi:ectoine hydroxylase-related dioxygenase (phytanoyl-CoA dioxygenase family)|nr:phytanoyl-CoA dioxygenase family protein [Gammaproteobacteria bacterium]